jgi:hypothetical protein
MPKSETNHLKITGSGQAKIDAIFAQRSRTIGASENPQPISELASQTGRSSGSEATQTKIDSVFAQRAGKRDGRAKIDALFGERADSPTPSAPPQDEPDRSQRPELTQRDSAHADLARTDWTRMTESDVAATAAYAVSMSRDATQATAFMIRRASSNPAFRKALAPDGLQPGQTFSDICRPAVNAALAERGWC